MGRTFSERYCEAHGCAQSDFPRRIFWKCLHRRAIPWAPFLLALNSDYFAADRDLISEVGRGFRHEPGLGGDPGVFREPEERRVAAPTGGLPALRAEAGQLRERTPAVVRVPPSAYTVAGDEGLR